MKKSISVFSLILILLVPIIGPVQVAAGKDTVSYIDVTTTTVGGDIVKGSPLITAVPDPSKPVKDVTFYAKAINEPEANYYPYITQSSGYSWSWPTGAPWVPDGEYIFKMDINYSSGEAETITREIIVNNYDEPNAPEAPTELTVPSRSISSVSLSWDPSVAQNVYNYVIYKDGKQIAETKANSFTVEGLSAGERYQFRIKTRDVYNNLSIDESAVTVIVPTKNGNVDPMPIISQVNATGSIGETPGSKGYSGTVRLSVNANEKVENVDFFAKKFSDPDSAYQEFSGVTKDGNTYTVPWDTISAPEGNAMIKAMATDSVGQGKTVTNVFLVDNQPDFDEAPIWEPADHPPENRIVGYLAGWSTYGSFNILRDLDASRLTHLNYAFASIGTDLKIKMDDPIQDPINFADLAELKEKYPHLQTMISVGGWGGSANFSVAAANEEARTIFAESAVDFIVENGFNGVDLDWEYPVTGGGPGTYPNPADRENFPLLLEKVREKLDEQGEKDGKHYLLTIAGGATADFTENTQLGESQKYLDYVQIMTYDIHGTWETVADFTAPLFDDNGKTYSVDKGVQAYLDVGVPKNKLVMGVPFYGYTYNVTSSENNGLRQPVNGSGSITYNRIVKDDLLNSGYERFWDEGSKVPYFLNKETLHFISHDDEESIGIKAEYIKDRGLGGAMIWEISQDHENDLLASLYDVLKDPFEKDETPPAASEIKRKVKQFAEKGAFENEDVVHLLTTHLTSVSHYENKEQGNKVIKHMESFKLLIKHQKENKLMSDKVYNELKADADSLIKKWQ